ncbi:gamma-glutamyltransferase [candidate division KSB1 bacterium]|nr:gamma-glutamyltransferase [candidate division KSB1 bacterium]
MKRITSLIVVLCIISSSLFAQGTVVSPHPVATEIGMRILKQGGNAVDAALAVMFALSVVEPWASGMGSGGEMIISTRKAKAPVEICFRERAPIAATPGRFYRNPDDFRFLTTTGYRSVCVPGMLAGATLALEKYGTMDATSVLTPAIELAHKGFAVTPRLHQLLVDYYDLVERDRTTGDIFMPDWLPLAIGDTLKRHDLATTMETFSMKGMREFYVGEMADDVSRQFRINDGFLTLKDFQQYRAVEKKVMSGTYRGYTIWSSSPPSAGGLLLIELMQILENFNIRAYRQNSGPYIHLILEALKYVLKDRTYFQGDPAFTTINTHDFESKSYAKGIAARIDTAKIHNPEALTADIESGNGSHLCVIDNAGNAVSVTQTMGFYFGSGVTEPETGILFNNGMYHFSRDSLSINAVQPRKMPALSIAPTILMLGGRPVLIIGASGADRIISALAQVICGVIDFDMDIQNAVDAPRFHFENGVVHLETRIDSDAIEFLKHLGHNVRLRIDYDTYFGIVQAIYAPSGQPAKSGTDPRGAGNSVLKGLEY